MNTSLPSTRRGAACVLAAALLAASWAHGANSATNPKPRPKQAGWTERHEAMKERVKQGDVDLLFIGDAITQGWEGAGAVPWERYYGGRNAVNLGVAGDRTEHVLWRLQNSGIGGIAPKLAVVMVGTENHKANSAEEISEGVTAIMRVLRNTLPETRVILLGIFPRGDKSAEIQEKLKKANRLIADLEADRMVTYMDIGAAFTDDAGNVRKELMPDGLHPNEAGYGTWAEAIEPKVKELLGE